MIPATMSRGRETPGSKIRSSSQSMMLVAVFLVVMHVTSSSENDIGGEDLVNVAASAHGGAQTPFNSLMIAVFIP
jgi:hypothetical protein